MTSSDTTDTSSFFVLASAPFPCTGGPVQGAVLDALRAAQAGGHQRIDVAHPVPGQGHLARIDLTVTAVRDDGYEADEVVVDIIPENGTPGVREPEVRGRSVRDGDAAGCGLYGTPDRIEAKLWPTGADRHRDDVVAAAGVGVKATACPLRQLVFEGVRRRGGS